MRKYITLLFIFSFLYANGEMINCTNFESQNTGTAYTRTVWETDGFQTGTWDNGLESRTQIDNSASVSGQKALRITYPSGTFGPDQNGAQVELKFTPRDEVFMSYWVRFSENFSFGTTNEGGKLPGLTGGDNCSGGSSCDGTNGFSARYMWRSGGRIGLYLYHMDKPNTYGEDYEFVYSDGSNAVLKRGEWYHIMERVKINTDGNTYDGEVEVWINGNQVLNIGGLRFTSNGDKVDKLYISTFHGGDDNTWAPTETCYTWFDDIRIGTTKEDVDYQLCRKPEIGSDKTICTDNPALFSVDENLDGDNLVWYKEDSEAGKGNTLSAQETGTYILHYDSAWCSQKDTVHLYENLYTNLGADRNICSSSFETLNANITGSNIQYNWWHNNIKLESKEATIAVKDAGTYTLEVSAPGCQSAKDSITLTSGLLKVSDVHGNANETITINLNTEKTNFGWYESTDEENPIATGNSYNTTLPEGTSYLYVKDLDGFSGLVGKQKLTVSLSFTDNRFERKMEFITYKELTIDSITIYPVETQDIVIRILMKDQDSIVSQVSYKNLPQGEQRIAIGANLPAGSYYMDAVGSGGRLRHSNADDAENISFPYTIDGLISILGSNYDWINNAPYYLFFYNWRVSCGNTCARTPILLEGKNTTSTNLNKADSAVIIYPTITKKNVTVKNMPQNAILYLYDGNGKLIESRKNENNKQELTLTLPKSGNYLIIIDEDGKTETFKIIAIN